MHFTYFQNYLYSTLLITRSQVRTSIEVMMDG